MMSDFNLDFFLTHFVIGIFLGMGVILVFLAMIGISHLYILNKLENNGRYETKKYIWTREEKK